MDGFCLTTSWLVDRYIKIEQDNEYTVGWVVTFAYKIQQNLYADHTSHLVTSWIVNYILVHWLTTDIALTELEP